MSKSIIAALALSTLAVVGFTGVAQAQSVGTTIVAGGPTDYLCIWQQIKTGRPCKP
jgi:hypothetical protein